MTDITRQLAKPGFAWVKRPEKNGLRLVGFADEIARRDYAHLSGIGHTGWFTDDTQSETLRGVVYRLPASHGGSRFVAGYADPFNNAAFLDLGRVFTEQGDAAPRDAAYAADDIARTEAEQACEYAEVWQARRRFDEALEEIHTLRHRIMVIVREVRLVRQFVQPSDLCEEMRLLVRRLLRERADLRTERAKIEANYSMSQYWATVADA